MDVIVRDDVTGSAITLTLLPNATKRAVLVGVVVFQDLVLQVETTLDVPLSEAVASTDIPTQGNFTYESDGEAEAFTYSLRSTETGHHYRLWHGTIVSKQADIQYQAFASEDPVPLLVIGGIAAGAAGLAWLWRRHERQDKAAIETLQEVARRGLDEGRTVDIEYEAESELTLPLKGKVHGKSKFRVRVGERPAA